MTEEERSELMRRAWDALCKDAGTRHGVPSDGAIYAAYSRAANPEAHAEIDKMFEDAIAADKERE